MAMIRKCGSIGNSPSRTPLSHQHSRRRMTLGMLLSSPTPEGDRKRHPRQNLLRLGIVNNDKVIGRSTLKGLMSSSSSNIFDYSIIDNNHRTFELQKRPPVDSHGQTLAPATSIGGKKLRHGTTRLGTASTSFRIRILKRAWRPVLGVIPEGKLVD